MAILPSNEEIKREKSRARRQRQRKVVAQQKAGKGTEFPAYGAGVMPENVRAELKGAK